MSSSCDFLSIREYERGRADGFDFPISALQGAPPFSLRVIPVALPCQTESENERKKERTRN